MSAVRIEHGPQVRPLRRVRGVQQLSDLQARPTKDDWREMPQLFGRRSGGAEVTARQDVLRLQPLSGLRFRRVGQAASRKVPELRRRIPDREIPEIRSGGAVPEWGMQIQEAD